MVRVWFRCSVEHKKTENKLFYRHRLTQINTNLFLERKALPKELYFLSTGSFFRKKVFFEKEIVLRKSV